ncbi:MAG: cbb3-type cytochrome oxidase assembly protein CcoS [Betaproteobacteria bacterium]|nr:cbb3-type cytochrome oxidase assembly protein CcoS [Betaproteobacteria bacterium]
MESLYLLIPLSVLLVFGILLVFAWSLGNGQFDDLEAQGRALLEDDDSPTPLNVAGPAPGSTGVALSQPAKTRP